MAIWDDGPATGASPRVVFTRRDGLQRVEFDYDDGGQRLHGYVEEFFAGDGLGPILIRIVCRTDKVPRAVERMAIRAVEEAP